MQYPCTAIIINHEHTIACHCMPPKRKATLRRLSDWERIDVLKEDQTLPVSSRGSGLCLYLPKDICEVYGLISGDMLKIRMLDHFRKIKPETSQSNED
jgi:hypothetical protein